MSEKRIALVTGGARGIGLGVSIELAIAGFDLAICGRKEAEAVSDAITILKNLGAAVHYIKCDISSSSDRKEMVSNIRDHYGKLNVLVNNAGVAPQERADMLEATEKSFDFIMEINLKGAYFLTQEVANYMAAQKKENPDYSGSIIFVTSCSSEVASTNRGDYCLSKAALSMAAKLYAARMAEFGVNVYEIRPGVIKTDMTSGVTEKYDRLLKEGLTLEKRWGTPEDIGKTAAALASGEIPYATGQVLKIDGGMTVQTL